MRLVGAVAAVALVACGSARDCTVIGCTFVVENGVMVLAPSGVEIDPASLTVCVDGDCESPVAFPDAEGVPAGALLVVVPGAEDGDDVTVTLERPRDPDFTGTATMRSTRPNGPDCGPTCTQAEVSLAAG